jgi:hypothetical protein
MESKKGIKTAIALVVIVAAIILGIVFGKKSPADLVPETDSEEAMMEETGNMEESADSSASSETSVTSTAPKSDTEELADIESDMNLDDLDDLDLDGLDI